MKSRTSAVGGSIRTTAHEHQERDRDGERARRLVRGDVRLQRIDPAADDPGQLAAAFTARPGRAEREQVRRQVGPQRALEPARGAPAPGGRRRPAGAARTIASAAMTASVGATASSDASPRKTRAMTVLVRYAATTTSSAARSPHATASPAAAEPPAHGRQPALERGRWPTGQPTERPERPLIAVVVDDRLAPEDVVDAGRVEEHERDADQRR